MSPPAPEPVRFVAGLDVVLDRPVAGLPTRMLAAALDYLVLALVWAAFSALTVAIGRVADLGTAALVWVIGSFLLQWGWFVVFELASGGRSPGKMVVRLRTLDGSGARIGVGASLIRNLLRPADLLVGPLVMLSSPQSRRIGDIAASTVVVHDDAPDAGVLRDLPDGLSTDDVRMLEAWFARAATLPEERREALAASLVVWAERRFPSRAVGTDGPPEARLEQMFPRRAVQSADQPMK
jgi:uncharacterized RDD family membrane protein YckC